MKRLPIGISDFKKVIEGSYSYIDKSLLIQEVLELGAEVLLFLRPRRFGKTLNLSMLKYFFEKTREDHSFLFKDLKIWQTDCRKLQGTFPVVFLTFKGMKNTEWEMALRDLQALMGAEFERHQYLVDALHPEPFHLGKKAGDSLLSTTEKELFQKVLRQEGDFVLRPFKLEMHKKNSRRFLKNLFVSFC